MALRDRGGDGDIIIPIEVSGEEEIDELNRSLEVANRTIRELNSEIDVLKERIAATNVDALERKIAALEKTAERAADAFLSVMKSINIAFVDDNGITQFSSYLAEELYDGIKAGEKTFHAAISEFKTYMPEAFQQVGASVGAAFDQDVVINFTNSLTEMQGTLTQVFDILQKIDTDGVRATAVEGAAGGGDITATLEKMKETASGMDGELRGACEAVTKLVEALASYAGIDAGNLASVSAAFRNLVELGHTTFSEKKANNIISFASRLKDLQASGSVNFEIKGLDALKGQDKSAETLKTVLTALKDVDASKLKSLRDVSFEGFRSLGEVHANSSSLKALSEYLPALSKANANKLKQLSDLSWTKLNHLDVKRASLKNLAEFLPQIAKANMDRLSKLQSFNFDNFKNIHINRGSIQTINDLVTAMTSFTQTAARLRDNGGFNTEYMLGNIARVARQGRELLEGNMEARGHISYDKLSSSVTVLEEVLANCAGDADRLNDVLEMMGVSAPDTINTATSAMQTLRKEMQESGYEGTVTLEKLNKLAASMQKAMTAATKQDPNMANTQAYRDTELVLNRVNTAIRDATQNGTDLRDALRNAGLDGAHVADQATNAVAALNRELAQTKDAMKGDKLQMHIETGGLQQELNSIEKLFDSIENRGALSTEISTNMQRIRDLFVAINAESDVDVRNKLYEKFKATIADTTKEIKAQADAERQAAAEKKQTEDLIRNLTNLREKLNLMQEKFKDSQKTDSNPQWKQLQDNMRSVSDLMAQLQNGQITPNDMPKAQKEYKDLASNIGNLAKQLGKGKSTITDYFKQFLTGSRIIMSVIRQIRQMINMSIELDKEMTQLQVVTRASNAEMEGFGDTILQVSNRIATSAKDLISATTTFARLGYTMEESTKLAEITGMLQNVGDIEASAAQNAITAIVKAFNVDVNDIEQVADKLVTVGKYIAQICGNTY